MDMPFAASSVKTHSECPPAGTQEDLELAKALRAQAMLPVERSARLGKVWSVCAGLAGQCLCAPAHGGLRYSFLLLSLRTPRRDVALDVDGMLLTKKTMRESDIPDRLKLKRLRNALRMQVDRR